MKGIFLSSAGDKLRQVYLEGTRGRLAGMIEFLPEIGSRAEFDRRIGELAEVEVIFTTWGMIPMSGEEIAKYLPKLRAVYYGAGSVQYFAKPFLERGVEVYSAWAANAVPVAEYTVAQIILANKGYFQRFHRAANRAWSNKNAGGYFSGNYGNKVGLIGIGMIGSLVAEMLKNYDLDVLAYDPFLPAERVEKLGLTMTSLENIFAECTVISNHLANNSQTVGMLNGSLFSKMMPNATFINTGRGAQVVEDDLIAALEEEPSRVALLDVTLPEPPKPDSKLYSLGNVFLSPHIAGSLGDEVARMGEYMVDEFLRRESGQPTKWGVTLKMLETMA